MFLFETEEFNMNMVKAHKVSELINNFDPRPLSGEMTLADFYVDTSLGRGSDAIQTLRTVLNHSKQPNKKILFMGHHGSGKSTELFKVAKALENDNFVVIFHSAGMYLDYLGATYIDVLLSVLFSLTSYCEQHDVQIDKRVANDIINYWNKEEVLVETTQHSMTTKAEIGSEINFFRVMDLKIRSFFQSGNTTQRDLRTKLDLSISEFINLFNCFLDAFSKKFRGKQVLLILDDLDKISLTQAENIFVNHARHITSLHLNIVYTFPIALFYSSKFHAVDYEYDDTVLLNMIKVKYKNGNAFGDGCDTIRNIVLKRADENLFESGVIDFVIAKSGGCIRTVMRLIREAAIKSVNNYGDDSNANITMQEIAYSYNIYRSGLERSILNEHIEVLKAIHETKKPLMKNSDNIIMDLLMSLAVIEYMNGERWCDLNPAIEDYLISLGILGVSDENSQL